MRGIGIGYYAAHEQFAAEQLLEMVVLAERARFKGVLSSDQLFACNKSRQPNGCVWDWLSTAMQASRLRFGIVNIPGKHYHPVPVAQQVATLCANFPFSFWIAVGNGRFDGPKSDWPSYPDSPEHNQLLTESVYIIKELWIEKRVTRKGLIEVYDTKLDLLPKYIPQLFGAALTETDALTGKLGRWLNHNIQAPK